MPERRVSAPAKSCPALIVADLSLPERLKGNVQHLFVRIGGKTADLDQSVMPGQCMG